MKIYDIANIRHCEIIDELLNNEIVGYTLIAHDGYEIKVKIDNEDFKEKKVKNISLPFTFNFSQIEIKEK